ncbi:MAG TPA: FAD binding domain-containing protein [Sphingobium sp.]|nr:FAD binding domain-containing protein [Sphingobium sp.]
MSSIQYLRPANVADACELLATHGSESQVIAGGVALIPALKLGKNRASCLIDISKALGPGSITREQDYVRVGASATLRAIGQSPVIQALFPIITDMERALYDVQTRNRGTIGGNLCYAGRSGEVAPVLAVLGAQLEIASSRGVRIIHVADFFVSHRVSALAPDELLVAIRLPYPSPGTSGAYCKEARRADHSPIANVAVLIDYGAETVSIERAVLVVGGIEDVPTRAKEAEALLAGRAIDAALVERASAMVARQFCAAPGRGVPPAFIRKALSLLSGKAISLAIDRCRAKTKDPS